MKGFIMKFTPVSCNIFIPSTSPMSFSSPAQQSIHYPCLITHFYFLFFILVCIFLSPPTVLAGGVFTTNISTAQDNFSGSFSNVEKAFEELDKQQLDQALPNYEDTPTSKTAINAVVNYRGLDINFSFASNSNDLVMTIADLNINETFSGTSRDDSGDLLLEYLKGAGLDSVNRIQKELARVSATDPVAGNPASLMGTMVSNNYSLSMSMNPMSFASTPGGHALLNSVLGSKSPTAGTVTTAGTTVDSQSLKSEDEIAGKVNEASQDESELTFSAMSTSSEPVGIGGSFGIDVSHSILDLDGDKAKTETIIFEYQYQFEDPLKVLRLKMPLAVTDTEDSITYDMDVAVAFSYPLTRSWVLTPSLSYGVGGSEDLGGGAAINGYSLLSSFRFVYGNYLYNVGNMIGHYSTGSVSLGDYEVDPGISNTVYRNGLVILKPSLVFNIPTMLQLILIDTRYSGDDLYTEHYYEVGFAFGLITDDDLLAEDSFNLGFTYLDSTDADIKGYKVNFGYRF